MDMIPAPIPMAPHPGRFAEATLIGPDHPLRGQVQSFIADTYRQRFDAEVRDFMPQLLAYRDTQGALVAAVGLRHADSGPLFVEHYLDAPVEAVLAQHLSSEPRRAQIAEVGHFAASTAGIARELIVQLAWVLRAADVDWVMFVATQQLRNAFVRLHLAPIELMPARAECMGDSAGDWGRYYESQPRVMCGDIREGIAFLGGKACSIGPMDAASSVGVAG
ncbi:thermostable hemolysin [uncultured Stenotrophomonas sp.]|uniref:thermostable hemolysin n=1 Tax=uncultured Stenotrophomonas sp. TaxID=165438 RepID=UPI0025838D37|nr:thermostable hemolysin [uncultured Stenotrophomonas sp.]